MGFCAKVTENPRGFSPLRGLSANSIESYAFIFSFIASMRFFIAAYCENQMAA